MSDAVIGTGIDLVECARVRRSVEKFGRRFLDRVFSSDEQNYAERQRHSCRCLAARFAAKEAFAKALGVGIGARLRWTDIEVRRRDTGEPYLQLTAAGESALRRRGGKRVHLSLTHTERYAAATVVITGATV